MLTADAIREARLVVENSRLTIKTPMISGMENHFSLIPSLNMYFKMENTQKTGSFKIRGVANQIHHAPEDVMRGAKELVTMSAGNYGKAFAFTCHLKGLKSTVVMPDFAPLDRQKLIEGYGAKVLRVPADKLTLTVDRLREEHGAIFMHPFDDIHLIAGHASAGLEILEDLPDPDIILVCCGGGGFLAGVAAAIRALGPKGCRIYGVEPEGAPTMYNSFQCGEAVQMPSAKSIAAGLSPPYAGKITYELCRKYVDDIILVSDDEIKNAVKTLYSAGFVVEPSGGAAFAALLSNKVPLVENKKVVVTLSGGNITPADLLQIMAA